MKKMYILHLLIIALILSTCKKEKNAELFVGTYEGNWRSVKVYYQHTDTSLIKLTADSSWAGTFDIIRVDDQIQLNGKQKLNLKELEYDKKFFYHSPTTAMMTSPGPINNWTLYFYPNRLNWKAYSSDNEQYGKNETVYFEGIK